MMRDIFIEDRVLRNLPSEEITLDDKQILFVGLQEVNDFALDLCIRKLCFCDLHDYLYSNFLLTVLFEEVSKEQIYLLQHFS